MPLSALASRSRTQHHSQLLCLGRASSTCVATFRRKRVRPATWSADVDPPIALMAVVSWLSISCWALYTAESRTARPASTAASPLPAQPPVRPARLVPDVDGDAASAQLLAARLPFFIGPTGLTGQRKVSGGKRLHSGTLRQCRGATASARGNGPEAVMTRSRWPASIRSCGQLVGARIGHKISAGPGVGERRGDLLGAHPGLCCGC